MLNGLEMRWLGGSFRFLTVGRVDINPVGWSWVLFLIAAVPHLSASFWRARASFESPRGALTVTSPMVPTPYSAPDASFCLIGCTWSVRAPVEIRLTMSPEAAEWTVKIGMAGIWLSDGR
jgi:hypothetical protein